MTDTTMERRLMDPVILVIGITGAGKTTFVNQITGSTFGPGNGVDACTTKCNHAFATIEGVRVALVDTPGIDAQMADTGIVADVRVWIQQHLSCPADVTAVLYFHDITKENNEISGIHNLNLLREIVGRSDMKMVALVSTKWDASKLSVAENRQASLMAGPWDQMLSNGARFYHLDGTKETSWRVVEDLLEAQPTFVELLEKQCKSSEPSWIISASKFALSYGPRLAIFVAYQARTEYLVGLLTVRIVQLERTRSLFGEVKKFFGLWKV